MVTRYTAAVIQYKKNDIRCTFSEKDKKTGKYAGAIDQYKDNFFHTRLISSNYVFNSEEEVILEMKKIVKEIQALNLKEV